MNVNKHPKVALAWTLEGVNNAEADGRKRPGDGRVERDVKFHKLVQCSRACTKDKTEDTVGEKETMNKHKQKQNKFMRY